MPKQVLNSRILLIFLLLFLCGCDDENYQLPTAPDVDYEEYDEPLIYLNRVRNQSGLSSFSLENKLSQSAAAHANYLILNKGSLNDSLAHDEESSFDGFSGKTPQDRAIGAGYQSRYVKENISFNEPNYNSSIDALLSAIYHRFAFLNYNTNTIGFGSAKKDDEITYVYNMGNSFIEDFCKKGVDDGRHEKVNLGFCKNRNLRLDHERFLLFERLSATNAILFPNKKAQAFFGNEMPDPFPLCKISANPVSIEFHPRQSSVEVVSFELFSDKGKLPNSFLMSKRNDPNSLFNSRQFALFHEDVLEFGKTYRAKFNYLQDGIKKTIEWDFKTKTPSFPYFVVSGGEKLLIEPKKSYQIFFMPKNCNDIVKNYSYSTTFLRNTEIKSVNLNLIQLQTDAYKGGKLKLRVDGRAPITILFDKNSKDFINYFGFNRYVGLFLIILSIIIFYYKKIR